MFTQIDYFDFKYQKVQREFRSEPFFCDVSGAGRRSATVPTSVHRLTPGDIDIVGALGDSLTAANGAFAIDDLQTTLEGRGVSWAIGGKDNWRRFITMPNLLKEFNPNLYGFSTAANSLGFQKESKFNVAEPGAISGHTIRQAKNLVKRMRSDPKVDMQNHWKVVTIMIGSNDFCLDVCYSADQDALVEQAGRDMMLVLRILRENLPRTLVNVVLPVGNDSCGGRQSPNLNLNHLQTSASFLAFATSRRSATVFITWNVLVWLVRRNQEPLEKLCKQLRNGKFCLGKS